MHTYHRSSEDSRSRGHLPQIILGQQKPRTLTTDDLRTAEAAPGADAAAGRHRRTLGVLAEHPSTVAAARATRLFGPVHHLTVPVQTLLHPAPVCWDGPTERPVSAQRLDSRPRWQILAAVATRVRLALGVILRMTFVTASRNLQCMRRSIISFLDSPMLT